ncbi:hypothetical protein KO533_14665 [Shewanella sp. NKUCC05_KAH]|uniref:hypothetical protein n=1 Tax=Shewanella sp. NKUCC05_KAH TaxID=2842126 RepID=UPI001C5BECE3|nr:hypothetical protein [Shewanella sp. NKUCC05_KAH]MBW3527796.1 hypothetical protein [Shewanella sp. NKUCC05_KAH]
MFKENTLINPVNEFTWRLPVEKCDDKELDWMIKNLLANFQKLYGCTVNIVQIQSDYLENKNNGTLDLLTFNTNSIEYFFLKIDTIFDILYQVYFKLCNPERPAKKSKHAHLEDVFTEYKTKTGSEVDIKWLTPINAVRNRIAHGGFSVKCFILEEHFAFQAYDLNLNERIKDDFGFFVNERPIVYTDLYTNFYTQKTHEFIQDFLGFVIYKVSEGDREELPLGAFDKQQKESASALYYGGEKTFLNTSRQIGKRA